MFKLVCDCGQLLLICDFSVLHTTSFLNRKAKRKIMSGEDSFVIVDENLTLVDSVESSRINTDKTPLESSSETCVKSNSSLSPQQENTLDHSEKNNESAGAKSDPESSEKRIEARIQNIKIQVSSSNGEKIEIGGIECVKMNLVNEELLKKAEREAARVKSLNAKLTQELKMLKSMFASQNEEMKGLKAQCEVYKQDLELERTARQKSTVQIATDLQSVLQRNHMLVDGTVGVAAAAPKVTPAETVPAQSAIAPPAAAIANLKEKENDNAVNRLHRIQNLAKRSEPVYILIEERRLAKGGREFVMEVECNGEKATGAGFSKRMAKRMAAESILLKMGYTKDGETSANGDNRATSNVRPLRKVAFKESAILVQAGSVTSPGGSAGRQLMPGVLLMKSLDNLAFQTPRENDVANSEVAKESSDVSNAKEKTDENDNSAPSLSLAKGIVCANTSSTDESSSSLQPVDELLRLAKLRNFEVRFDELPKDGSSCSIHRTLVKLDTIPPLMCTGFGDNAEESIQNAAERALKTLKDVGI